MPFNPNGGLDAKMLGENGQFIFVLDDILLGGGIPNHQFEPVIGNLFSAPPSAADIKQNFKNCYFLAALLAIIDNPQGSEFINHMMTDLGNGHILVRLFNLSPSDKKVIYIQIQKTVLYERRADQHFSVHQDAWVSLLEKAYAAYRLTFSGECFSITAQESYVVNKQTFYRTIKTGAKRTPLNQVEALTGGRASDAFEIILGKKTNSTPIISESMRAQNKMFFSILTQDIDRTVSFDALPAQQQQAYYTIFSGAAKRAQPGTETQLIRAAIDDYRKFLRPTVLSKLSQHFLVHKTPRRYDALSFIHRNFFLASATNVALQDYIYANIPDKRGSKSYTPCQQTLFEHIKNILSLGQLICIASSSELESGEPSIRNPSTIGSRIKGLTGPHAYQVLNCYERAGYKFLLVRNPWHYYVREYTETPLCLTAHAVTSQRPFKPVQPLEPNINIAKPMTMEQFQILYTHDFGVFELAIEDVVKRFVRIDSCDPGDWRP